LVQGGIKFSDVIRTWFYNDDILRWYGDFNQVRSKYLNRNKVFEGSIPAITGMEGRNHSGSALVIGFLVIQPKDKNGVI